jgi:hypothetical protein
MKNGISTIPEGDGPRSNPFDSCNLSQRLNQGHDVPRTVVSLPNTKFQRQDYFRTYHEHEVILETTILGLKQDRQSVSPELAPDFPEVAGHGTV